ncbi:MAG: hypothetical protein INF91_08165 [Alphaproteobacteria bacterium]|nr:hypothetical protein [Alphaproteobacteria bacterium]
MRPRPIVHIGVHKTATSWFQQHCYPHVRSHRVIDRIAVRRAFLGPTAFGFEPAAARAALGLDEDDALPALICEEDLSGVLHNGGLTSALIAKEVAMRLAATIPDAQIVILVREQAGLAAACYQQYLREGGTYGPRRYLFPGDYRHLTKERPFKTPRFEVSQFAHAGLVGWYDALFGRENVHVFAYEAFARDRERFLDSFRSALGLEVAPLPPSPRVNASYGRGLIPLARVLNGFTERSVADKRTLVHIPYWYPVRKRLLEGLATMPLFGRPPSPAALFGGDAVAWLRGTFAADNARLAARMGVDLAALGYALAAPPAPKPQRHPLLAALRN